MFEKRLRKYFAEISCGVDRYAKFHHWFIVHLKHSTVTVVSFGFLFIYFFISALFVSFSCIFSFIFISNSVHGFCFSLIETINRWKQFYAMISMSNQKLISFIQFSATEAQSPIKAFQKKKILGPSSIKNINHDIFIHLFHKLSSVRGYILKNLWWVTKRFFSDK